MPVKVIGDFEIGREQMKLQRRESMKEITRLERKIENQTLTSSDRNRLNRLDSELKFCSVSVILPAEIEGIMVNVKTLQAFVKKLQRDHVLTFSVDEQKLTLVYQDRYKKRNKGKLILLDISKHFKNYVDVPKLVIDDAS